MSAASCQMCTRRAHVGRELSDVHQAGTCRPRAVRCPQDGHLTVIEVESTHDQSPQVLVAPPNDRLVGIWQRPTESLFTA